VDSRRLPIALAVVLTAPLAPTEAQIPAERPSTQLLIDVVAVDRNDNPVTDLRRDEVEIWISGYRVPVDSFVSVTPSEPRSARLMVLVLDDMTVPPALMPRVREAARRFVDRMTPGDEIAIVGLNGSLSVESTNDRIKLLRAIDSYNVRATGVVPFDALGAQVLKTVGDLSSQLGAASDRRKTIVGIGSGWLFDRPIPPPNVGRDLRPEWTDAMRALSFANANFYVIDPAGVGGAPAVGGSGGFAHEAGGYAFLNTNDVDGVVDRIMREASTYYLIAVTDPPIQRKAGLRELDVRVLRRGVSIRVRRSIQGGT
jgi:VWFA-related protein